MDVHDSSPPATAIVPSTIAEAEDADDGLQVPGGASATAAPSAAVAPIDTSTTLPIVLHDEAGHKKAAEKKGKRRASREELSLAKKHDEEEEKAAILHSTGEGAISNIVQPTLAKGAAAVAAKDKLSALKAAAAAKRNKDEGRRKAQIAQNADVDTFGAAKKKRSAERAEARKHRSDSATSDPVEHAAKMAALTLAAETYDSERAALDVKIPESARRRPRRAPTLTKDEKADAHRHFHNLHPMTNKIVGAKWHAADCEIHERKLSNVRSTIDTSAPRTYSHLDNKKKALQIAKERQAQIDRDNDILLEKMASIMQAEKKQYAQAPSPMRFAHSLHSYKRARDAAQIDKDNQAMLHRLKARESFYPHGEYLASRRQNLHYLSNIAEYPDRFRQEEADYETLTKTHTRCHNPTLGSERQEQLAKDWTTPSLTGYHAPTFKGALVHGGAHGRHQQSVTAKIPVADTDQRFTKEGGRKTPPPLPGIASKAKDTERESSPVPVHPATIVV
ncbi:hypothetical protein HDU87_004705 [Geranomyces variabilis]|uniref:Uncharacterized protein n=1 Tax=Geranomyces variabilis TaxID=109894 RepID=A0AAD5THT4_9FUNG|nr:hypothetical protein HDU87_004705 [Geranomyces variabilis]